MAKKNQLVEKIFQLMSLSIIIFALHGCKSKKAENSFILDNIQYELNDGGVGYNVKSDNSLDSSNTSFSAMLHITNLSKSTINLDSSKFKLASENGISIPLKTNMNGVDVSVMYKQKIKPGEAIDYMLTFAVPKDGHYNLHIISPISNTEEVIHY